MLSHIAEANRNWVPGVTTCLADCQEYRNLGPNPHDSVYYLSLVCNSDGAKLLDKGHWTMHPVQFCIAELPFGSMVKEENMVLAAVNVGKKAVNLQVLYEPVVQQLTDLSDNGFSIVRDGQRFRFKVRLLNGLVDLPERAKLLNMSSYK